PQVFSIAIAMSLVPAISNATARKRKDEINNLISSGIRMTLLIGLPSALGLLVLAKPIIGLLYYNNTVETIASTGEILQYLSLGVVFLTLVQALTAMLQGLGKPIIPVINLFIGAVFKLILTYILTAIPSINVKGAAISTVVAYGVAAILDLIMVRIVSKTKFEYMDIFIKPLISSVGMAIVVRLSYISLLNLLGSGLSTIVSVIIGIIVYSILLIITGTITNEDLALMPKGDVISEKINKFKLLK